MDWVTKEGELHKSNKINNSIADANYYVRL